jgi:hypothetical protein
VVPTQQKLNGPGNLRLTIMYKLYIFEVHDKSHGGSGAL